MDEKPLHVRDVLHRRGADGAVEAVYVGVPPPGMSFPVPMVNGMPGLCMDLRLSPDPKTKPFPLASDLREVPRYDTDWAATGPLIERYKLALRPPTEPEPIHAEFWEAYFWDSTDEITKGGQTPLIAVCNLILALSEAGKLPKENTP